MNSRSLVERAARSLRTLIMHQKKTYSIRLRIAIEIIVLMGFLVIALMTILVRSPSTSNAEGDGTAEEHIRSGDDFFARGSEGVNGASIQYWEAVKLYENSVDARFKLASIYYELGWNDHALYELREVERMAQEHPGLHLLLGKIYDVLHEPDMALEPFKRAVALQPTDPEALYYLGTIYQQKGMEEKAIEAYKGAVATGQTNLVTLKSHLQLGRIFKKSDLEEAKSQFEKALSIDSTYPEVVSELRNVYRKEAENYEREGGKYTSEDEYDKFMEMENKAIGKYIQMVNVMPDDPRNVEIYVKLGDIYRVREEYDKAVDMYKKAGKLDPMNYEVFSALKLIN